MRDFVVKLNPILFFNDFGEITSGRRWLDRWAVGMVPSLHASGLEPTPLPCWHLGWGLRPRPCLGGLPPSPGRGLPPSPGSLATSHCSTSHRTSRNLTRSNCKMRRWLPLAPKDYECIRRSRKRSKCKRSNCRWLRKRSNASVSKVLASALKLAIDSKPLEKTAFESMQRPI